MKARWALNYHDNFSFLTPLGWKLVVYKWNPHDTNYWLECPTLFKDRQILSTADPEEAKRLAFDACKKRLEFLSQNIDKLESV